MKKLAAFLVVFALLVAAPAMAKDVILQGTISDIAILLDKNGNEYVRIILPETRTLSGIQYNVEVVATGFRNAVTQCEGLRKGDTLKAVADQHLFQGKIYYRILKVVR